MAGRLTFLGARETWRGMTLRSWGMQAFILVQMGVIVMLTVILMRSDRTIVFAPALLDRETEVTRNAASISYWEDKSLLVAHLLGNVSPRSVDFVLERLREIVAPEAYRRIIDVAARELGEIRKNSMSILFEAESVIYDPVLNRYFVQGTQHIILASDRRSTQRLVFEMDWTMENYRPQLTHIDSYAEAPRTAEALGLLNNRNAVVAAPGGVN